MWILKKYSTQYTLKHGKIEFSNEDETKVYHYKNNVIFSDEPLEKGKVPDSDRLDTNISNDFGDYTITFSSNGEVKKYISLFGINNNSFYGNYERNENQIVIHWKDGSFTNHYTEDGLFYDVAYFLK